MKELDEISYKYANRDVKSHFDNINFLQFYEDVIFLHNKNKITLKENIPMNKILDENKFKSTIEKLKKIKDKVRNYSHSSNLKNIYIYPTNSKEYMYKIDAQTFHVYFIKSDYIEKLNSNFDFLRFDFNLRSMFFEKENLLFAYKSDLYKVVYLSSDMNNKINKDVNLYVESILYIAKWFVSLLAFLGFLLVLLFKRKIENDNKEILTQIKIFEKEKQEYSQEKHYSQHDIKTNSQIILDKVFYLYEIVKGNEEAEKILSELNMLEYTILQANSYSKDNVTGINEYNFKNSLKKENFYEFFQHKRIEKPFLQKTKASIFDVKVNIENMDEFHVVNVKDEDILYKNELSMVLFKLLNNAIKHRKPDTKIKIEIILDKNDRFLLKIRNQIVDDDICQDLKNRIETIMKNKNLHNMSIITGILEKYNYIMTVKCYDKELEINVSEKD